MFGRGSYFGVNGAEIDVPAALADVVGVADSVAKLRPLAADITYSCHNSFGSFQAAAEGVADSFPKPNFTGMWGIAPD